MLQSSSPLYLNPSQMIYSGLEPSSHYLAMQVIQETPDMCRLRNANHRIHGEKVQRPYCESKGLGDNIAIIHQHWRPWL